MEVNSNRIDRLSTAVFLIFIGSIFLLGNLGYISFKDLLFLLIQFWPILVILAGIKLMIGAFKIGKLVNLIIDIVFNLLVILFLCYVQLSGTIDWDWNTVNYRNIPVKQFDK